MSAMPARSVGNDSTHGLGRATLPVATKRAGRSGWVRWPDGSGQRGRGRHLKNGGKRHSNLLTRVLATNVVLARLWWPALGLCHKVG